MTPTDFSPADAETHTPDQCDDCQDETCLTNPCATMWVTRRRRHRSTTSGRLPQHARW